MKKSELRQLIREEIGKESYTRVEVIELLHKYRRMAHTVGSDNPMLSINSLNEFIAKNLYQ